jgi:hypothetical protein
MYFNANLLETVMHDSGDADAGAAGTVPAAAVAWCN